MDRTKQRQDAHRSSLPKNWQGLGATQIKGVAQDFIGRTLDEFAAAEDSPDAWEAQDLMLACGLIAGGMYTAAVHYADRALTPTGERSPEQPPVDFPPTLAALVEAHHAVSSLPPIER